MQDRERSEMSSRNRDRREVEDEEDTGNWLFTYDGWLAFGIDDKGSESGRAEHLLRGGGAVVRGRTDQNNGRRGVTDGRRGFASAGDRRLQDESEYSKTRDGRNFKKEDPKGDTSSARTERKASLRRPSSGQDNAGRDQRKRSVTWDVGNKEARLEDGRRRDTRLDDESSRRGSRAEREAGRGEGKVAERGDLRRKQGEDNIRHADGGDRRKSAIETPAYDDVDSAGLNSGRTFRKEREDPRRREKYDDVTIFPGTGVAKIKAHRVQAQVVG